MTCKQPLFGVFILVLTVFTWAEPSRDVSVSLSLNQIDRIVSLTSANFWGRAVGRDGKPFIPENETERAAPLIPADEAVRVVNEARVYGLALWCELKWEPVYLNYMQLERSKNWTQKQVAFIGMLFGVTQSVVLEMREEKCGRVDKRSVRNSMDTEKKRLSEIIKTTH
jgi:hypothetical protein